MKLKENTVVYPLPTDELIEKQERFWRLKLPGAYVDFIKKYNGVEAEQATFIINNRNYYIERFLCMLDDIENNPMGIYDIDVVFSQIGERLTDNEDLIGAEVLPIAVVFAGDIVCLDYRDKNNIPSVCVWSHEESGLFQPVLNRVANSFQEFLAKIEEYKE